MIVEIVAERGESSMTPSSPSTRPSLARSSSTIRPDGLVRSMRAEALPEPFVETVQTGWWTTCLEILPARERAASRY